MARDAGTSAHLMTSNTENTKDLLSLHAQVEKVVERIKSRTNDEKRKD